MSFGAEAPGTSTAPITRSALVTRSAIAARVDKLEQQLSVVSGEQRRDGMGQRLFEAKECVTQNIEDSDRDREAPQTAETVRSIIHLIRTH